MRELDIGFRLLGFETHSGPEASARAIASLLGRAEESIFILADRLTPYFYQHEAIQASIAKALKKGVNVALACGPEPKAESIDALKSKAQELEEKAGKITLYVLKQRPTLHFVVVDRKHVRIEKPHPPEEEKRHGVERFDEPGLARELENLFAELISKAASHEVLN